MCRPSKTCTHGGTSPAGLLQGKGPASSGETRADAAGSHGRRRSPTRPGRTRPLSPAEAAGGPGATSAAAAEPARSHVVRYVTPLELADEGRRQSLLAGTVIAAHSLGAISVRLTRPWVVCPTNSRPVLRATDCPRVISFDLQDPSRSCCGLCPTAGESSSKGTRPHPGSGEPGQGPAFLPQPLLGLWDSHRPDLLESMALSEHFKFYFKSFVITG